MRPEHVTLFLNVIIKIVSICISAFTMYSTHLIRLINRVIRVAIAILAIIVAAPADLLHQRLPLPTITTQSTGKTDREYVQIHNWTTQPDADIPAELRDVLRRPLRWRPTYVDTHQFRTDIAALSKRLSNKWDAEGRALLQQHRRDLTSTTRIRSKYQRAIKSLQTNLQSYCTWTIAHPIRNRNSNRRSIDRLRYLRRKYPHAVVVPADKGRGNVYIDRTYWRGFNHAYLNKNGDNFRLITDRDKQALIAQAKNEIRWMLTKTKYLIADKGRVLAELESGKYDRIGKWAAIPKVHKRNEDGSMRRALRPLINHKQSIISVPCMVVREVVRKLNAGLVRYSGAHFECDDIRDVIIAIKHFNAEQPPLDPALDRLIVTDINSMYDNISFDMVRNAYTEATAMLPNGYISPAMESTFLEALQLIEKHATFEYSDQIRMIINSQIQGSMSGADTCSLVLRVMEAGRIDTIHELTRLTLRYKDDILCIPRQHHLDAADFERDIIGRVFPEFEFETEMPATEATMCDIVVSINADGALGTRLQHENGKVRMYVLKSSNVRQRCSSVLNTLCQRYIVINDTKETYLEAKKLVCETLLRGEWTEYDIRRCRHPKYEDRDRLLETYITTKTSKLARYRAMVKLHLLDSKWFKNVPDNSRDSSNTKITSTCYLKYQKTLINDQELRAIINQAIDQLPDEIKNVFDYNLFYKYQPSVSMYTCLT